jgi:sugar phosphate permease
MGVALSNAAAGYIVQGWGYEAAFGFLALIAIGSLALFLSAMPETRSACMVERIGAAWQPSSQIS